MVVDMSEMMHSGRTVHEVSQVDVPVVAQKRVPAAQVAQDKSQVVQEPAERQGDDHSSFATAKGHNGEACGAKRGDIFDTRGRVCSTSSRPSACQK